MGANSITSHWKESYKWIVICPLILGTLFLFFIPLYAQSETKSFSKTDWERYRENNRAPRWMPEMNALTILYKAYAAENEGTYPRSWNDLEKHFGKAVWGSKENWEKLKKKVTLVPAIAGEFQESDVVGPVRLKMMAVFTDPFDQERDVSDRIGRWIIWQNPQGEVGCVWHSEKVIKTFGAWPEVEKLLNASRSLQKTEQSMSPTLAPIQRDAQARTKSESHPFPEDRKPSSSTIQDTNADQSWSHEWLRWIVALLGVIAVFWLWLKTRSKN